MAWHQRLANQIALPIHRTVVEYPYSHGQVGATSITRCAGPRTDRIETTRMTAMASIRLVSGGQTEVPNDARLTDRGIEWLDDDGVHHVVPWTAVVEFIGPPPTPPTPMVEKM
jgi:hypothetical protein